MNGIMDGKSSLTWWASNSKWVATTLTIIGIIGGYLFGVYKTTLEYDSKVETLHLTIKIERGQDIKDLERDIMNFIQNRLLTKTKEE